MKKNRIIGLIIAIFVIVIVLSIILTSCKLDNKVKYSNADKYVTNYTTLKLNNVKSIEVNWLFGDINIKSGNNIDIIEEAVMKNDETISDDYKAHYYLDDDKLIIQFAKNGQRIKEKDFEAKNITLTIPYSVNIDIDSIAANVNGESSKFKSADIDTVSGNVILKEFDVETIDINSTSGTISCTMCDYKDVTVKTVSGQVYLQYFTPNKVDVKTTSGDIVLYSLTKCGFNLNYKTLSGSFVSTLELVNNGRRWVYGDGECTIDVKSTSGNISIRD